MIKFFRKIRQQLLTENKFTKYLLYAIGEIVLVVIGILIALQINNANEKSKSEERTKQLLINVQKELLINIKYSNIIIDYYRGKDSLIFKVLNKKATYNDYKNNIEYRYLINTNAEGPNIDGAFKNFIKSNDNLSAEQDSIAIKLSELYGEDKKNVDRTAIDIKVEMLEFLNKLKIEKKWYYKYVSFYEVTDEMIDYFLNDPFYLNQVSSYEMIGLGNHCINTVYFRNRAIDIYYKISENLNLKKDTLIDKNVKDYEHYIGTYNGDNQSTINIKEEKNELIIQLKQQSTTDLSKSKLYLDSKTYFTYWNVFGQLIFDKDNEVNGLVLSRGTQRVEYKKVK